jgi:hypothetical protein
VATLEQRRSPHRACDEVTDECRRAEPAEQGDVEEHAERDQQDQELLVTC